MQKKYIDSRGKSILLGKEIGRGGEGCVYELQDQPTLVAKIYSKEPDPDKAEKIRAMTRLNNANLLKLAAWPISFIEDHQKKIVGFTMEKLTGYKPLFELYSPKLRLNSFPKADWRFLIHAAMNTARAFTVIHEMNHVVGDVNHGNLLISQDSTVKFIDTDSFQVLENSKKWFCEVGVSTHQPPEMQGLSSYKGITRTPNHDNFGLAVLIFQLLCLARHPFSGRFLEKGDMPIEKAITEHRYAYSSNQQRTSMLPPPASISILSLSPEITALFERAFSPDAKIKLNRPNGREWIAALSQLFSNIKQCTNHSGHHYFKELIKCPWCEIESQILSTLFPIHFLTNTSNYDKETDFYSLITQLEQLSIITAWPKIPDESSTRAFPSYDALQAKIILKKHFEKSYIIGGISSVVICLLCKVLGSWAATALFLLFCVGGFSLIRYEMYVSLKEETTKKFKVNYNYYKQKWDAIKSNWHNSTQTNIFKNKSQSLKDLKQKYDELDQKRDQKIRELQNNKKAYQLNTYLNRFYIRSANIEKIGSGKCATLLSYGIETAADVSWGRLSPVPGFGSVLTRRLIDWRSSLEKRFMFNNSQTINPVDKALIDREFQSQRAIIKKTLIDGIQELKNLNQTFESQKQLFVREANETLLAYTQAAVNAKEVKII